MKITDVTKVAELASELRQLDAARWKLVNSSYYVGLPTISISWRLSGENHCETILGEFEVVVTTIDLFLREHCEFVTTKLRVLGVEVPDVLTFGEVRRSGRGRP